MVRGNHKMKAIGLLDRRLFVRGAVATLATAPQYCEAQRSQHHWPRRNRAFCAVCTAPASWYSAAFPMADRFPGRRAAFGLRHRHPSGAVSATRPGSARVPFSNPACHCDPVNRLRRKIACS
jgi:hypothetical protein